MAKFVKRPVVVEATQWFKAGDHDYVFVRKSPFERDDKACADCGQPRGEHGWIERADTGHIVCPGDWIITGVQGERYPCKPDIFESTYKPVDEDGAAKAPGEETYQDRTMENQQRPMEPTPFDRERGIGCEELETPDSLRGIGLGEKIVDEADREMRRDSEKDGDEEPEYELVIMPEEPVADFEVERSVKSWEARAEAAVAELKVERAARIELRDKLSAIYGVLVQVKP